MFTPGEIQYNGIKYFDPETQQEVYMSTLVKDAGNGSLTAGHLDLKKSYKTFGTLGQGALIEDQGYYDVKFREGQCSLNDNYGASPLNFIAITFLPQVGNSDPNVIAQAKIMGKSLYPANMNDPNYIRWNERHEYYEEFGLKRVSLLHLVIAINLIFSYIL